MAGTLPLAQANNERILMDFGKNIGKSMFYYGKKFILLIKTHNGSRSVRPLVNISHYLANQAITRGTASRCNLKVVRIE